MSRETGTAALDWHSILLRYAKAVMNDDIVVGSRCMVPNGTHAPEWTEAETAALMSIHREAWPDGFAPWSEAIFWERI